MIRIYRKVFIYQKHALHFTIRMSSYGTSSHFTMNNYTRDPQLVCNPSLHVFVKDACRSPCQIWWACNAAAAVIVIQSQRYVKGLVGKKWCFCGDVARCFACVTHSNLLFYNHMYILLSSHCRQIIMWRRALISQTFQRGVQN